MKVLLINGSPHEHGCTRAALDEVARTLSECGVETELINLGAGPFSGCRACGGCAKTGRCVINDGVNEAIEALAAADGLIVGTPVHYASPAGALLAFLDRMFFAGADRFAHKPAIVSELFGEIFGPFVHTSLCITGVVFIGAYLVFQ